MKNLKLGISALALTVASTVFAQTTTNPWLIGVGAHGVNHTAVTGSFGDTFGNTEQVFNLGNYSITPPLSKLTVARNINKFLAVDWQTTVGNVENKRFNMGKEFMLMTGLGLQFKINGLWNEDSWFDPYVRIGANYLRHDYQGLAFPRTDVNGQIYSAYDGDGNLFGKANHFTAAGGIGSNFWLTKAFGVGVQGDYVGTPTDKSNVANFWQGSASLLFRFGNTDRDKDGILDKDDACPDTPGLPEFQGCPDTDGDGIPDKDDECIDVPGPVENNGCPWPDTDGDGLIDKDDACPTVAGPMENNGCPWPDTDEDGILDKDDACPTVPGLAQYNGCPKPRTATSEEATNALNNIYFNFGKATLRPESSEKINAAAKILMTDGGTYVIEGQTDKKGSDAYNLKLSRQRAAAVVDALEARGVSSSTLKSRGVGEAKAMVSESASDEARLVDRKVVVIPMEGAEYDNMRKNDMEVVPAKKATRKK
ncbi:OmpA family protein [Frigoriflavimonas asaccharolytica]|uniref:Outer membrane protein OmpA-like peptidoglycan-associated protein n=1 Tax=Frigoriflavimonas asaccharolytica TaxID=2735899 RepID=A0A8J8GCL5_9FLAO|nr:OmpA family protein [Frigoriflavimonas asaccharolytica]NRS93490.1 outer membrane protein OmpA-like peptidoglycan-associated protein [Frigoriflavimonas asaccharolytica]